MDLDKRLKIRSNKLNPAKGCVLLSEPFLGDFYFKRSVVLLAEHNDEGSFGLIMNKPISARLNEVVIDFPDFNAPVYIGGPVDTENLFFIHQLGELVPDSNEILKGLYWGGDIESVKELIRMGKISSNDIRFYVGYSGWDARQLESELKINSWVVSRASARALLGNSPKRMWESLIKKMGSPYELWPNFPIDPSLN